MIQKRSKKYRAFPANEPCPCDSGLTYKECCKPKAFRFELDEAGRVHRTIELHPELEPRLKEWAREFKRMFGRKPGKSDPILYSQYLHGNDDFWQQARTVGRIADTREELIFAWRRSGFIVGEHSRELMPESDYAEWEDAIDEYFIWKEEGLDPFHVFTYLPGNEYEHYKSLIDRIDSVIIALGFTHTKIKRISDSASYFRHALIGRSLRSLRTIREMFNTRYDDDCLAIARSVYESYLRLVLLRLDSSSSLRFEAMIAHAIGLFPNKIKKNGQPDYSKCIDPDTGAEFEIVISNRDILKISDSPLETEIYYDLYPLLSGHVHPEPIDQILRSLTHNRGDQQDEGDPILAIVLILAVCLLLLKEVAQSSFLTKQTIRDVLYVHRSIFKELQKFVISPALLDRGTIPQSIYRLLGIAIDPGAQTSQESPA